MSKSPFAVRRLIALSLLALACSGDGGGGTAPPTPKVMQKAGGDDQSGLPGATLPQPLEVRITDAVGSPQTNLAVTFTTTGGTLDPPAANTDVQGRARTVLTLPSQSGSVTVTASAEGVTPVTFTAQAATPAIVLTTPFLPAARRALSYARTLGASGGPPNTSFAFSVTSGALPPGLALAADGSITGTPTTSGGFPVTIRASAGASEVSQAFTLNVCDAPLTMSIGEVRTVSTSARGSCGIFLPAGNAGARYRITVARTDNQENGTDVAGVSFLVSGNGVTHGTTALAAAPGPQVARRPVDLPELHRYVERRHATSREHARLLAEGEALVRRLGTGGLLRPRPGALLAPAAADPLPDRLRVAASRTCTNPRIVTAFKLAENDWLAVYQDSAQNAVLATQVTPAQAAKLAELATKYGKPIIDRYFGSVHDVDGNGRVIVFITPDKAASALGIVWTGDFFRKSDCPGSNEGEYIYLDYEMGKEILSAGPQEGQHALVHELKHVSSLYRRLLRAGGGTVDPRLGDFHPDWMEEGGAELAAELAARYAWSELGGPAMNVRVTHEHYRMQGANTPASAGCRTSSGDGQVAICTENFAVLFKLFDTQHYLSRQPNSVVVEMAGPSRSSIYYSGWVFTRWLGDAYGNAAAAPFGDEAFFKRLHDADTPSGVRGIETVTGKSWEDLMQEYAVALTAHGWGGVTVPRAFTSYDFVSAIEIWCFAVDPIDYAESGCDRTFPPGAPGAFPWPVTTDAQGTTEARSFGDTVVEGGVGPSGVRVHELLSNGSGVGAEINIEITAPSRIVVVRLR